MNVNHKTLSYRIPYQLLWQFRCKKVRFNCSKKCMCVWASHTLSRKFTLYLTGKQLNAMISSFRHVYIPNISMKKFVKSIKVSPNLLKYVANINNNRSQTPRHFWHTQRPHLNQCWTNCMHKTSRKLLLTVNWLLQRRTGSWIHLLFVPTGFEDLSIVYSAQWDAHPYSGVLKEEKKVLKFSYFRFFLFYRCLGGNRRRLHSDNMRKKLRLISYLLYKVIFDMPIQLVVAAFKHDF